MKNRNKSSKLASLMFAAIGIFTLTYLIFVITVFFILDLEKFPWKLIIPIIIIMFIFMGIYYFLKELREYRLSPEFLREDFDKGNPVLSKIYKLMGG